MWKGIVIRVDDYDDDNDDRQEDLWIGKELHQQHRIKNFEILVNMFSSNDFDIVLTINSDNFIKNKVTIDGLKTGNTIEFSGHITKLALKSDEIPNEFNLPQIDVFKIVDLHQK